jgi:hypothetical protein
VSVVVRWRQAWDALDPRSFAVLFISRIGRFRSEASRTKAFGTVAHLEDTHFALERDIYKLHTYINTCIRSQTSLVLLFCSYTHPCR